mmetsp:Transcript_91069/g.203895  ORF Transcript_91069/g.203895 Transcript_91069/m.203895 type:complete len:226 (+) Transcript_91069:274-951(+)
MRGGPAGGGGPRRRLCTELRGEEVAVGACRGAAERASRGRAGLACSSGGGSEGRGPRAPAQPRRCRGIWPRGCCGPRAGPRARLALRGAAPELPQRGEWRGRPAQPALGTVAPRRDPRGQGPAGVGGRPGEGIGCRRRRGRRTGAGEEATSVRRCREGRGLSQARVGGGAAARAGMLHDFGEAQGGPPEVRRALSPAGAAAHRAPPDGGGRGSTRSCFQASPLRG